MRAEPQWISLQRAEAHASEYVYEVGDLTCSCGWQICELDPVKADAAMMRHLRDEGVIV